MESLRSWAQCTFLSISAVHARIAVVLSSFAEGLNSSRRRQSAVVAYYGGGYGFLVCYKQILMDTHFYWDFENLAVCCQLLLGLIYFYPGRLLLTSDTMFYFGCVLPELKIVPLCLHIDLPLLVDTKFKYFKDYLTLAENGPIGIYLFPCLASNSLPELFGSSFSIRVAFTVMTCHWQLRFGILFIKIEETVVLRVLSKKYCNTLEKN